MATELARMTRERIEAGDLLDATEELVRPGWGICCGLRFLAQAEPFLDPADVLRLRELADSQDARDEFDQWMAEFLRLANAT